MQHFDTAFIGAGMAGLAAGIRLALAGKNCHHPGAAQRLRRAELLLQSGGPQVRRGAARHDELCAQRHQGHPADQAAPPAAHPLRRARPLPAVRLASPFPGCQLRFNNDFAFLESEVARAFPRQIDGFRALTEEVARSTPSTSVPSPPRPARPCAPHQRPAAGGHALLPGHVLRQRGRARHGLRAVRHHVPLALFRGLCPPLDRRPHIIKLLQSKYRDLGGVRKMKCGIRRIHARTAKPARLSSTTANPHSRQNYLHRRCRRDRPPLRRQPADAAADNIGQLSFTETITVLDQQPADFGWDDTIIFSTRRALPLCPRR